MPLQPPAYWPQASKPAPKPDLLRHLQRPSSCSTIRPRQQPSRTICTICTDSSPWLSTRQLGPWPAPWLLSTDKKSLMPIIIMALWPPSRVKIIILLWARDQNSDLSFNRPNRNSKEKRYSRSMSRQLIVLRSIWQLTIRTIVFQSRLTCRVPKWGTISRLSQWCMLSWLLAVPAKKICALTICLTFSPSRTTSIRLDRLEVPRLALKKIIGHWTHRHQSKLILRCILILRASPNNRNHQLQPKLSQQQRLFKRRLLNRHLVLDRKKVSKNLSHRQRKHHWIQDNLPREGFSITLMQDNQKMVMQ